MSRFHWQAQNHRDRPLLIRRWFVFTFRQPAPRVGAHRAWFWANELFRRSVINTDGKQTAVNAWASGYKLMRNLFIIKNVQLTVVCRRLIDLRSCQQCIPQWIGTRNMEKNDTANSGSQAVQAGAPALPVISCAT